MIPMIDSLIAPGAPAAILSIGPAFSATAVAGGAILVWMLRAIRREERLEHPPTTTAERRVPEALAA